MSENNFKLKFDIDLSLMNDFTLKAQGAEAKIYEGEFLGKPAILKQRFVKKYRHDDLDRTLTTERIRSEVRSINKCHEIGIKCPAIYFSDLHRRSIIFQEITNSITVKDFLKIIFDKQGPDGINSLLSLAQRIGENIAALHKNDIIHGDLTTSNLLLKNDQLDNIQSDRLFDVYFIDFGLSKRNVLVEDKAVDLYVLERAISSSLPNSSKFYDAILDGYFKTAGELSKQIANQLEEVRQRGRKRSMVG